MKTAISVRSLLLATCAGLIITAGRAKAATPHAERVIDYLWRPSSKDTFSDPFLTAKFFPTSFDCGRFAALEGATVSIYSDSKQSRYWATLVISSKDLNSVASSNLRKVPLRRVDVPIPRDAALAVRKAWTLMLERPFAPQTPIFGNSVVLDGFADEFSIALPDHRILRGVTPGYKRAWGPHVRQIWDLGVLLMNYCESSERRRRDLAEKIKRRATILAASLESKQR